MWMSERQRDRAGGEAIFVAPDLMRVYCYQGCFGRCVGLKWWVLSCDLQCVFCLLIFWYWINNVFMCIWHVLFFCPTTTTTTMSIQQIQTHYNEDAQSYFHCSLAVTLLKHLIMLVFPSLRLQISGVCNHGEKNIVSHIGRRFHYSKCASLY